MGSADNKVETMSKTITLEEPTELRKHEIEERLEKVALGGLANIYHAITGKTVEKYVALGMATSAVSSLRSERDALRARVTELEAALRFLIADCSDYPAWQRPCLAMDKAREALARAVLDQQQESIGGK